MRRGKFPVEDTVQLTESTSDLMLDKFHLASIKRLSEL